jgi:hypothetical protein
MCFIMGHIARSCLPIQHPDFSCDGLFSCESLDHWTRKFYLDFTVTFRAIIQIRLNLRDEIEKGGMPLVLLAHVVNEAFVEVVKHLPTGNRKSAPKCFRHFDCSHRF